jgi:hypothetical protein
VIDLAAANHTGRELELMLAGKKPLAMFYADLGWLPDEEIIPEERFAPYVTTGEFVRSEIVYEDGYHPVWQRDIRTKYVFFALNAEAWRIPAIILAKAVRKKVQSPNEALDRIEGALLGYTDEEVDAYCASHQEHAATAAHAGS